VKRVRRCVRRSSLPADGRGVAGCAGTRLLADLADVTGLTMAMSDALAPPRQRDRGHDPGRVAVDVAVMLADGGEAIADLAILRNQSELFGSVASDATAWRVLDAIDDAALNRIRTARARAREVVWAQAAETGRLVDSTVAGFAIAGLVSDLDATVVITTRTRSPRARLGRRRGATTAVTLRDLLAGGAATGYRYRRGGHKVVAGAADVRASAVGHRRLPR
jgi:hypothetical protein